MNLDDKRTVTRYICELLMAVCVIVSGIAQLKITLINWSEDDK